MCEFTINYNVLNCWQINTCSRNRNRSRGLSAKEPIMADQLQDKDRGCNTQSDSPIFQIEHNVFHSQLFHVRIG